MGYVLTGLLSSPPCCRYHGPVRNKIGTRAILSLTYFPPDPGSYALWISQLAHAGWCGVHFRRQFLLIQFSIGGCWVFCQDDVTRYWLDLNIRAQGRGASDLTCCYLDVYEESPDQVDRRLTTFSSTLPKFKLDCTTSYFKIFGQTVIIDVANFWRMV